MSTFRTNFPGQNQLLQFGFNGLREAYAAIFQQVNQGRPIQIPKTMTQDEASDTKAVKGLTQVSFFQGQQLANGSNQPSGYVRPQDEHLLITGVAISSANEAAGSTFGTLGLVQGLDTANPALCEGYLTIVSNGVKFLDKFSLQNFQRVAEDPSSGNVNLSIPVPWMGQTDLEARVEFPTAPTATAGVYMQVRLLGIGLS